MKIGYIRVSTQEQNTIRQEVLMEALGVDEVYIDRMSGKNTNRPELQKMMEYVRKGDTMICTFEAAMGLHPLWLYLFQKIGARNIGEIETVSHAIQFVQLDQH